MCCYITCICWDTVFPCCCNSFINLTEIWLRCTSQPAWMYCVAELDGCRKSSDSVATTIQGCHGCQSWALVSENGRWACQTSFKPQAGIFPPFFLHTVKLCTIIVYVRVYESRGAFRRICIIHCTLIMDRSPSFCVRRVVYQQGSSERIELIHKDMGLDTESQKNKYMHSHVNSPRHEHTNVSVGFIWAFLF